LPDKNAPPKNVKKLQNELLENLSRRPLQKSSREPVEKPSGEPVEKPSGEPFEKPSGEPLEPVEKVLGKAFGRPVQDLGSGVPRTSPRTLSKMGSQACACSVAENLSARGSAGYRKCKENSRRRLGRIGIF
jgi:hypothetical protein